jgi:uncharacterized membrane protein YeaQ/YmgE (transglycosylase-associated protein family)
MQISLEALLIWIIIALFVGFLGELIARRRAPDGLIGATVVGFIAILLIVGVLHFSISGEPTIAGVPLISSIIAAAILVALWSAFAYRRVYRPSYERYYHRRGGYVRRPRTRRRRFGLF